MRTSLYLCWIVSLFLFQQASAEDWPQWRGPQRDNKSQETGLLTTWPEQGPPLRFRIEGLGEGITSLAVVGNSAFTLSEFDGHEYVVAFNAATGERLWITPIGLQSKNFIVMHPLMRWLSQRTPTVSDGKLYAVTSYGTLACLETENGKPLWTKDFREEYEVSRPAFGYCDYPLVDGDLLICVPGGSKGTIVALNRHTGEEVWRRLLTVSATANRPEGFEKSAYAATLRGQIGGLEYYVVTTSRAIHFIAKTDGKVLGSYDHTTQTVANSQTPLFDQGQIVSANGYGGGISRLELSYTPNTMRVVASFHRRASFDAFQDIGLIVHGKLFHSTNGQFLTCVDANSGETTVTRRLGKRFAHTYADGHLYCVNTDGLATLTDVNSLQLEPKSTFQLPNIQSDRGVTMPVISNRRLYLRFGDQLSCFDISDDASSLPTGLGNVKHVAPKPNPNFEKLPIPVPIFVPTPPDVVARMLKESGLKRGQKLVDLGSGDGRIVIAAAKSFGATAVGYEIDEELIARSRANAAEEKLAGSVRIEAKSMYEADLSNVDVLALYLNPVVMDKLKGQIVRMPAGSFIVSHQFKFPGVEPDRMVSMQSEESGEKHSIYLYQLPLKEPVP